MEPLLGQIILWAPNFAPRGWAFCHGQILSIAQNTALFSLLGTTYGGDGQTTFALPDLRGRVPVGAGQGPGLSDYWLGEVGGAEAVTLLSTQMPAHTHQVGASTAGAHLASPSEATLAQTGQASYGKTLDTTLHASSITPSGGNQPHENRPPFLGLNYIIALEGIFPSRD